MTWGSCSRSLRRGESPSKAALSSWGIRISVGESRTSSSCKARQSAKISSVLTMNSPVETSAQAKPIRPSSGKRVRI